MRRPQSNAILRAAIVLTIAIVSSAQAQTLTEPNPQKKSPQPSAAAKSLPAGRAKSCDIYGPGFAFVPASGMCMKVGGYIEGSGVSR